MAIYHAQVKSFSRGKGDSSIAAAAYRAGIDLTDTKTREVHRFSARHGVISYHMLTPPGAPAWCKDVRVFWDFNEQFEARQNARLARECEVSLPSEMTKEQREKLALALGQLLVDRYGTVVLAALHGPTREGDKRNFHVHLLMSARQVGPQGFGKRAGAAFDARKGEGAEELRVLRELVGNLVNDHLQRAGIDQTIDHRSLKDQASAARQRGDLDAAAALTREPGKHHGRAITAILRAAKTAPAAIGADAAMEEAMARAAREGRLVAAPAGHSHQAAHQDRLREVGNAEAPSMPATRPKIVRGRLTRSWAPSRIALHLSRQARLGRLRGQGSALLDAEAKVIEEWLESQIEAANIAVASIRVDPTVRVEKELLDAVGSYSRRRVGLYGKQEFFFEDTEELTFKIQEYAAAFCEPRERKERLVSAKAKLSELLPTPGSRSQEICVARRVLHEARLGVGKKAERSNTLRVNQARREMTEMLEHINRKFHITAYDPLGLDKDPFLLEKESGSGGERKSDSNRQELRPNLRPRI